MRPASPKPLLRRAGVPTFLVTNSINVAYLSGISVSSGAMLGVGRRWTLYVDDRYRLQAQQKVLPGVHVKPLDALSEDLASVRECGFEADNVSAHRIGTWKRKYRNTKFVQVTDAVEEFRRRKSPAELAVLRRARRITHELLRRVPAALRTGVTEERLARQLQIWALELGADGMSFDPIVAFGTHTASPHHRPTSRPLKKGYIVQIDVGAKVRGYCADASMVFFTARPTQQQKFVFDTLVEAQHRAIEASKPGASTHKLDELARSVLRAANMDKAFTHALGHGVGLEIHEGVTLSSRGEDRKLLKGEVITIEPGAYFDGRFGMRVEDMIFVGV